MLKNNQKNYLPTNIEEKLIPYSWILSLFSNPLFFCLCMLLHEETMFELQSFTTVSSPAGQPQVLWVQRNLPHWVEQAHCNLWKTNKVLFHSITMESGYYSLKCQNCARRKSQPKSICWLSCHLSSMSCSLLWLHFSYSWWLVYFVNLQVWLFLSCLPICCFSLFWHATIITCLAWAVHFSDSWWLV